MDIFLSFPIYWRSLNKIGATVEFGTIYYYSSQVEKLPSLWKFDRKLYKLQHFVLEEPWYCGMNLKLSKNSLELVSFPTDACLTET